ncbi:roadblock/LC7 domain-containing protein [Streptosporangium fragile]|uniref:roadblock/LC7 domain-containing protein n=1 Tax=Streptosporangium fragile TaxID=46186 RepID=UPI0031E50632
MPIRLRTLKLIGRRMPVELREEVRRELALLRERIPDVDGSVVCSVDGLTIADDLKDDSEQIGALSSALLALSRRMTGMAGKGAFEETLISGTNGYAACYAAGPKIVLTVLARPGTNLGLLRLEGRKTAARLAAITSRISMTQ